MFKRTYEVKGEDVNDFMVMQHFAYLSYASRIVDVFLFEEGYSRQKLNNLKIGLQECGEELIHHKQLMFGQTFFVNLEFATITNNKQKVNTKVCFFNIKKELCAVVFSELCWFDYGCWEVTTPPKKMGEHFLTVESPLVAYRKQEIY